MSYITCKFKVYNLKGTDVDSPCYWSQTKVKSSKLKRLCPPNSVVMYTSFHEFFLAILWCKIFGSSSLSNHGLYSPLFGRIKRTKLMQQNIWLFFVLGACLVVDSNKWPTVDAIIAQLYPIADKLRENFDCPPVSVVWPFNVHVISF